MPESALQFCSYCNSKQPTFEHFDVTRCQTCGYPIGKEPPSTKSHATFRRPKILVIDDDKLLLALTSNLLAAHDFVPLTASDGASGIELAKKERPDLVLLDIMMPGATGFEVCQRMRSDPQLRDTPVILVTAMEDPALALKGFKAGATLAIRKPLDQKVLVQTILTALAMKAAPPDVPG